MSNTQEVTLAGFERKLKSAHRAHQQFEKAAVYKDDTSHDLLKGNEEYARYSRIKMELENLIGQFPFMKEEIDKLP